MVLQMMQPEITAKQIPGIVFVLAPSDEILFSTLSFDRLPEKQVVSSVSLDTVPSPNKETIHFACQRVLCSGKAETFEMGEIGPTDLVSWYHCNVNPIYDLEGKVIAAGANCIDISAIKKQVERLRRREAQLVDASIVNATLEATADGILVIDQHENITGFNQVFLDLWRIPRELIENRGGYSWALGYVLEQLMHPESCLRKLQEIVANPELESHDILEFKDGRVFERYSRPQKTGNRTIGRVFSYRDATARIRAEQALKASEARKTAILDSALDSIITMDHSGRIVELNPAAQKTFGYSQSYAKGKELAELIIPNRLREAHRTGLARYLETGEEHVFSRRLEFSAMREDGMEFPVEVSISRIELPGPPMFTGFIRDMYRTQTG